MGVVTLAKTIGGEALEVAVSAYMGVVTILISSLFSRSHVAVSAYMGVVTIVGCDFGCVYGRCSLRLHGSCDQR